MNITEIQTYPVRIPIKPERLMITALGRHDVSDYLLVRVKTDAGIEGAGEATISPRWSGETVAGAVALIRDELAPQVIGCDPCRIVDDAEIDARMDRACRHNWFAKSALEMACWDIAGKHFAKPVYELLGGASRPLTVRSRYSMGAYDADRAAERARQLVAEGFTTIKVKVGGEAAGDIARVRAVRGVIGDLDLVIDANCGWDVETAIHCVKELADCRLNLVEQPTPDGDFGGLGRLRRETGATVMADDICFDLAHARELVRGECCDVISVYPGKNGGIRKTKEIVEFAGENGVACSIGSNLELDVATAAMAHTVVACQNIQVERFPGDMLGPAYHEFSLVRQPIEIEGPLTTITDRPGLGVDVDWELARSHAPS